MTTPRALAPLAFATLLLGLTSCVDDAHFHVKRSPDLRPMTVSVLGVFKEGRLSPETWEDLGPKLSPVFDKSMCPIGYDTKLATDKPDLAQAIDDYSRANGVTDELLDQLAPAASGDAILVVTMAGRPLKQKNDAPMQPVNAPTNAQTGMMRGRGGGGGMAPPTAMRGPAIDTNAFEMSATLFSLKEHRVVADVSMGYGGESADEAVTKFVGKLRSQIAGFPCVGWSMRTAVDEKKILGLKGE